MSSKENIPDSIKNLVWKKYSIYPNYPEITQCCTCTNFIMMPQSIRKYHNVNYGLLHIIVNNKRKYVNGVAEFGHIISEKNGGKVDVNNLILQCKNCNTRQGSKNIELSEVNTSDCEMIDVYEPENIDLGERGIQCKSYTVENKRCKNKCLDGREFCSIHLFN